jgi:hypothetical protein
LFVLLGFVKCRREEVVVEVDATDVGYLKKTAWVNGVQSADHGHYLRALFGGILCFEVSRLCYNIYKQPITIEVGTGTSRDRI